MKVEKSVPIPSKEYRGGTVRSSIYPHRSMEVGDSFFVKGQGSSDSAAGTCKRYGRQTGKKFTARSVDGGIRIWRIK